MKKCKTCEILLADTEFWVRGRWQYTECKACMGKAHTAYLRTSKGQLARLRANAKGRNIEFTLTELPEKPEYCPILLVKPKQWAVDRVDNTRGYVEGNIRWVSNEANRLKSNMDVATVRRLLTYMES